MAETRKTSRICLTALLFAGCLIGCQGKRAVFSPRTLTPYLAQQTVASTVSSDGWRKIERPEELTLEHAEAAYARGMELRFAQDSEAADELFRATTVAFRIMEQEGDFLKGRAAELYRSSLSAWLEESQRCMRWDPTDGVQLNRFRVPCTYRGFVWKAEDFNRLIPVGKYDAEPLDDHVTQDGLGLPLIVVREREQEEAFFGQVHPFPATAVLVPSEKDRAGWVLELIDSRQIGKIDLKLNTVRLATDLSAHHAWWLAQREDGNDVRIPAVPSFTTPYDDSKLIMLEPYRPGTIPLVFVHGLGSEPMTWVRLANRMERDGEFRRRYQIWAFRYPSETAFLASAAEFREQLQLAVQTCQRRQGTLPTQEDPLNHMVLVGHSLGGILSKLQVTHSDHTLWRSVSKVPLEQIKAPDETKEFLRRLFYFEPLPFVEKVVFIGSPHRGSTWAQRPAASVAAHLVKVGEREEAIQQQLVRDNPGVLSRELEERVPTSIDLLRPDSQMLAAIRELRLRDDIILHNIIGTGRTMLIEGPADGVVSVTSAQHPHTVTETHVEAKHMSLHKDDRSIGTLRKILALE